MCVSGARVEPERGKRKAPAWRWPSECERSSFFLAGRLGPLWFGRQEDKRKQGIPVHPSSTGSRRARALACGAWLADGDAASDERERGLGHFAPTAVDRERVPAVGHLEHFGHS